MKRLTIILAVLLLLSACTKNTATPTSISMSNPPPDATVNASPSVTPEVIAVSDGYDDQFAYPAPEQRLFSCFAVDEEGIVYIKDSVFREEQYILQIKALDMNGVLLAAYEPPIETGIENMCVGDGVLYFTAAIYSHVGDRGITYSFHDLYSYDLQTLELKRLDTPSDIFTPYNAVKKLAYADGKLYILGVLEEYITEEYDIITDYITYEGHDIPSYHYQYDGTILAAYDIQNETFEIIFDDLIGNFSLTPDGKIMIFARDTEAEDGWGMSYFMEIDPETMSIGERIYRDIRKMTDFATDGNGVMYDAHFGFAPHYPGSLKYWPLWDDTGILSMMEHGSTNHVYDIVYHNGFTFYLVAESSGPKLVRIRNSIKITLPIKIIGANAYDEIPREGHSISFSTLAYDEFALAILAGGVAYDIAYIGTRQDFATNIRDKGSFYPLNDVPGVQGYLDACFPYIKDAATDQNGDIWMLPINIKVDAILYQQENCKKAGLDFANAATVEDIIRLVKQGIEYDPTSRNYIFDQIALRRKSLMKAMRNNDTLDTPEFRRMAPALKGFIGGNTLLGTAMPFRDNPQFLFDNFSLQTSTYLMDRDDLYIVPVTGTEGQSSADCVFLCVNPNSDKLERTLDYISAVCGYLTRKPNNAMLSGVSANSEYAKRLYALYENSVIDFNVSSEVFADDFDRYLRDEISLDELIKEASRKLAMYLNE